WTCIACHCLPLAVLMPRRLSTSAAARVERCAVSAIAPRTASAPVARCFCLRGQATRARTKMISDPITQRCRRQSRHEFSKPASNFPKPRSQLDAMLRESLSRAEQDIALVAQRIIQRGPLCIIDDLLSGIVLAP